MRILGFSLCSLSLGPSFVTLINSNHVSLAWSLFRFSFKFKLLFKSTDWESYSLRFYPESWSFVRLLLRRFVCFAWFALEKRLTKTEVQCKTLFWFNAQQRAVTPRLYSSGRRLTIAPGSAQSEADLGYQFKDWKLNKREFFFFFLYYSEAWALNHWDWNGNESIA